MPLSPSTDEIQIATGCSSRSGIFQGPTILATRHDTESNRRGRRVILGLPPVWRVTNTVEGAVVDTPVGRMLHVARAPLVRARELVAQRLAWRPGYELASIERVITDEGEFAIIAIARDGERELAWGIVFADESLAYYELESAPRDTNDAASHRSDAASDSNDATSHDVPTAREVVAIAARAHRFGLGLRWRRYRYAVPAGWDAIARGLVTDWYAPGHPRRWGVLTAYPAFPASGLAIGIVPSLVANAKAQGLVVASEESIVPESDHGLDGVGTVITGTFAGRAVRVQIAAFLDDRYVYAMELQSRSSEGWTDHQATLIETLRSIEPLPRQRGGIGEA